MIGNWQKNNTENINGNDIANHVITHICTITEFYKEAGVPQFENTR